MCFIDGNLYTVTKQLHFLSLDTPAVLYVLDGTFSVYPEYAVIRTIRTRLFRFFHPLPVIG